MDGSAARWKDLKRFAGLQQHKPRNEYSFWPNFVRLESCAVARCQWHSELASCIQTACALRCSTHGHQNCKSRAPGGAALHKAYALNSWHAVAQPHSHGNRTCLAPISEVQGALSSRRPLTEQQADLLLAHVLGTRAHYSWIHARPRACGYLLSARHQ